MKLYKKEKNGNMRIVTVFGMEFCYEKKEIDYSKKMKLGISYNIFDGEELLKASLVNIRKNADYINVVYQTTSNQGQKASENLEPLLLLLKAEGLIDKLINYEPDLKKSASDNERKKRNIGLEDARKNGCTHFMTMDADEFYYSEQFINAKKFIVDNKIDVSACMCYNYATPIIRHRSIYLAGGLAFIYKINKKSKFTSCYFPLYSDPTRKMDYKNKKFYMFSPHELVMHHYTYVRNDIMKKWMNSSSVDETTKIEIYEKAISLKNILEKSEDEIYNELTFPYCGGLKDGDTSLMKVEDYFKINDYLSEFNNK